MPLQTKNQPSDFNSIFEALCIMNVRILNINRVWKGYVNIVTTIQLLVKIGNRSRNIRRGEDQSYGIESKREHKFGGINVDAPTDVSVPSLNKKVPRCNRG